MNILVVDDEKDVRTLFEQRFRREIRGGELSFSFAYSGEEALAYLQEHKSEAELVLSDVNMPGMSGLELLQRIKQEYLTPPPPSPHVMMVTAYADDECYQKAMQLGANDFLTKPLNFSELKQKLIPLSKAFHDKHCVDVECP